MRRTTVTLAFFMLIAIGALRAQQSPLLESQQRAHAVVQRGIEAAGGASTIRELETVRVEFLLDAVTLGQGAHPAAPAAAGPNRPRIVMHRDLTTGRAAYQFFPRDTSSQPSQRLVTTPTEVFFHNIGANTVQDVDPALLGQFLRQLEFTPARLLEAEERAATLRWIGTETSHGRTYDVVSYADPVGSQIALAFETQSGRLARAEYLESHAQFGDHVLEVVYGETKTVAGLSVPHRIGAFIGDQQTAGSEIQRIIPGAPFDASLLERPADATERPMVTQTFAPGADPSVEQLSNSIYYIENVSGGYNVMFVDTPRGIVVLEPPLTSEVSRAVMDLIRETLPDRPIVGVLLTHYHFDHSGGLRGYLDHGAVVITTPGNETFVKDVARAPRSLDGQWAAESKEPTLAFVEGHRPFGDGGGRIEVYDVGPTPHVDEILIAYLPALKLLFVGDLYSYSGQVTPASPLALALAGKIEELGLDVETIVPVHGQKTEAANLFEAVRLAKEGS